MDEKGVARRWSQFATLVPVYILQFVYGMNQGYPAILTPQLMECNERDNFQINLEEESWIVSLDNFVTPVVTILSGYAQQALGPRMIVMACCLPYTVGWFLTAFAKNVGYLYAARLFVGVSTAIITTTVYTVEVSSKDMRGTFTLIESVLRCFGSFVVYSLGFLMRWDTIALYSPILTVIAFVMCFFIPESPVFLIHKNKTEEAEIALKILFGNEYNIQDEMNIIQGSVNKQRQCKIASEKEGKKSCTEKLWRRTSQMRMPEVYKPLLIIFFLNIGQQFNGLNVLRVYIVQIFNYIFETEGGTDDEFDNEYLYSNMSSNGTGNSTENCVHTSPEAYYSAMLVGFFRLLASLLLSNLLLRYRRRTMYFWSSILSIISLVAFATFNYIIAEKQLDDSIELVLKWASLAAACMLVFAVQLGLQTLPMLLSSELFPSEVRAFCKGITRSFACVLLVLSLKYFPDMEYSLTFYGTFYLFAGILLFSLPVVYFTLPETKDLGLELIQYYFTEPKTIFYVEMSEEDKKAHLDGLVNSGFQLCEANQPSKGKQSGTNLV